MITRQDWGPALPELPSGPGTWQGVCRRAPGMQVLSATCSLPPSTLGSLPTPISSIPPLGHRAHTWLFLAADSHCRPDAHALYAKAVHAHPCTHTHSQPGMHAQAGTHTSSVCVFVGCRQVQSPRREGVKCLAACGWSPGTTLSCLLVLSGPTRTASWRIWTRLG